MGRAWPCAVFRDSGALPEERRDTERYLVTVSSCESRSKGVWKPSAGRPSRAPSRSPRNRKAMPSCGP